MKKSKILAQGVPISLPEASGPEWLKHATEEELASTLMFGAIRYGDRNWHYKDGAPGSGQNILFNYLYDEVDDSFKKTECIRVSTRRFLLGVANYPPPDIRRTGSFGALRSIAAHLSQFNKFLFENNIFKFSDVSVSDMYTYLLRIANKERYGRRIGAPTLKAHIVLLHRLWKFRDRIPDGLQFDILCNKTAKELSQEITDDKQWVVGSTECIPDPIFISILTNALEWVTEKLPIFSNLLDIYNSKETAHFRKKKINSLCLDKLDEIFPLCHPAQADVFAKYRRIRRHMISACSIVILGFVGLRSHELLSLENDCISEINGGDAYGIFLILAKSHKMTGQAWGERLTWVAPDVIKGVLKLLITINRKERRAHPRVFPAGRGTRKEMTRGTLQTNINEFYKSMHQEQLPGDSPSATGPWHFRNHQFRKTFAKWVGTGSANSNVALMHHFKHLSIATTDGYIGTDSELYAEIAAYIESSTYNRIHSTLSHVPHIGGLAGAEITNKLNISSAEFMGSEGKEALRYRIDEDLKIAIRAGLTVVDCEFAYCLRRMDNKPKCGGKIARRGPDTCSGCNNFVVTPEHRGWWKQNLENNEDMYQRHINAGASENELLILKDITDKSRTALSKIDKWLETKNGT